MSVTWRSWTATWALAVESASSTCQTLKPCMEGSAVAMVTWRMEKSVTVEMKRCLCLICLLTVAVYLYFPCMFLPGLMTPHSATLSVQECTSPCCNANNCTLKAGAECAHGVCCHNCKVLTSEQRETQKIPPMNDVSHRLILTINRTPLHWIIALQLLVSSYSMSPHSPHLSLSCFSPPKLLFLPFIFCLSSWRAQVCCVVLPLGHVTCRSTAMGRQSLVQLISI